MLGDCGGMATDPQRQGIGAATADSATALWCLARATAVGFYQRNGWTAFQTVFDTDIGPHLRMWLRLAPPQGSTAS
jgi:hypothetical protein